VAYLITLHQSRHRRPRPALPWWQSRSPRVLPRAAMVAAGITAWCLHPSSMSSLEAPPLDPVDLFARNPHRAAQPGGIRRRRVAWRRHCSALPSIAARPGGIRHSPPPPLGGICRRSTDPGGDPPDPVGSAAGRGIRLWEPSTAAGPSSPLDPVGSATPPPPIHAAAGLLPRPSVFFSLVLCCGLRAERTER